MIRLIRSTFWPYYIKDVDDILFLIDKQYWCALNDPNRWHTKRSITAMVSLEFTRYHDLITYIQGASQHTELI
jgi:hypothetical protein